MSVLIEDAVVTLRAGRARRRRRRVVVTVVLALLVVAVFCLSLSAGRTWYPPEVVWRVLAGEQVQGASFAVGRIRLPRAIIAVLAGMAFGAAGVTFQVLLRNPLASPDIVGITSGAGAAAVASIVLVGGSATLTSAVSVVAGLATAAAVYLLARGGGVAGARVILIGIGVASLMDALTSYLLLRADVWDVALAMRWLTGSLSSAAMRQVPPLALAVVVGMPALLIVGRNLALLRLGDDAATGLGVRVERSRLLLIMLAVGLISFATAATGPIAFVAFLSGPIAARLVGPGGLLIVPSALVGALLVMVADLLGQFAFSTRFPVGVVTGVLGAPYLLYLLVRSNRSGGSL